MYRVVLSLACIALVRGYPIPCCPPGPACMNPCPPPMPPPPPPPPCCAPGPACMNPCPPPMPPPMVMPPPPPPPCCAPGPACMNPCPPPMPPPPPPPPCCAPGPACMNPCPPPMPPPPPCCPPGPACMNPCPPMADQPMNDQTMGGQQYGDQMAGQQYGDQYGQQQYGDQYGGQYGNGQQQYADEQPGNQKPFPANGGEITVKLLQPWNKLEYLDESTPGFKLLAGNVRKAVQTVLGENHRVTDVYFREGIVPGNPTRIPVTVAHFKVDGGSDAASALQSDAINHHGSMGDGLMVYKDSFSAY